jgi:hypothetical protein
VNRRNFLRDGLNSMFLTQVGLPQLLAWMMNGMISEASAGTLGRPEWIYMNLHFGGGPNRWGFDQWLKASASDSLVPNPHVATAFSGGSTFYQTFDYKGFQLPWMWNFNLATGAGGQRPMTDLLANLAVIRGYTTGADGHGTNQAKQTQPITGLTSVGGMMADNFASYISAIGVLGAYGVVGSGYHSAKGLSQIRLTQVNSLAAQMMAAFDSTNYTVSAAFTSRKQKQSKNLSSAADALMTFARTRDLNSDVLKTNVHNAVQMIRRGVGDLAGYWSEAVARYTTAINNSCQPNVLYPGGIPGITVDLSGGPVTADGTLRFGMPGTDGITHQPDSGFNMATLFGSCTITYLAQYLALAEYTIVNGFSSSIELPIGFLDGLNMNGAGFGVGGDEHGMGAGSATIIDAMFYRGVSAGLLELITTLKAKGVFNKTMIHVTGDFARSPKDGVDFHGSDHGYEACATSLFSGSITGPMLVGNILNTSSGAGPYALYPGTWGQAGTIKELGVPAGPGNVAASIANIMGVKNHPWTNTPPLLVMNSGKIVSAVESPRMVET